MTLSDSWDTPPSNPNNRRSSVLIVVYDFQHLKIIEKMRTKLKDLIMNVTRNMVRSWETSGTTK